MEYQLLVNLLTWLPAFFFSAVFLAAVYRHFHYRFFNKLRQSPINWTLYYKRLVAGAIGFRFAYAFLLTISQYYIWSQNKFTELLIQSPFYFIFYSYGRFWLNVFISVSVAFIFYLFLKFLKKYQQRFFEEGETELGFLAALIAGWPNFVVFLPLVFVSVILISLFRRFFLKEFYTTLGWPFLLAALIILVWGSELIVILGLEILKI